MLKVSVWKESQMEVGRVSASGMGLSYQNKTLNLLPVEFYIIVKSKKHFIEPAYKILSMDQQL